MLFAGIDAGSRAIKLMVIDQNLNLLSTGILDQGVEQKKLVYSLMKNTLKTIDADFSDLKSTIATGYGRNTVEFADSTITEITCHAFGVLYLHPEVKTIIDIGGQDSKVINIDTEGKVRDFLMNDRCAAGTGRFLEVLADRLALNIQELGEIAAHADNPAKINNMCVVFAETEITGLLSAGEKKENIIAGVQKSIASRISSMIGNQIQEPIFFTGGVALIKGMADYLQNLINRPINIAENPQYTGALGAALIAAKKNI